MGGQACVFYGAAEFSRDADLLVLADPSNLQRFDAALTDLQAQCIAVPPFEVDFLLRGHAVHFRCHHPEAVDIRVDIMSSLRGVDEFPLLWERRTSITDKDGATYELLALPDLVVAKKTQRSKDWPMLQRLLEAHYLQHRDAASVEQKMFWMRELRTPMLLVEAAQRWTELAAQLQSERKLLGLALSQKVAELDSALQTEQSDERERDRLYWQPLKAELEQLRHRRTKLKS